MDLMRLAAVMVTGTIIIAVHMTARVFHAPEGNILWRIARYVGGCVAILAGLVFVLDSANWLTVAAIVTVAGIATVVSYVLVELYNFRNRALVAEDDADMHHEL